MASELSQTTKVKALHKITTGNSRGRGMKQWSRE